MKAIRMQNLRSLADTGFIELKPITLLLGQNSSGKSTFLRMFPLLRQSVETRTSGPILWFGRLVDFGDFQTAVGKYGESEEISLGFQVEYTELFSKKPIETTFILKLMKTNKNKTLVKSCETNLFGHIFYIEINADGYLHQFRVNNTDFTQYNLLLESTTKIVPSIEAFDYFDEQLANYIRKVTNVSVTSTKIDIYYLTGINSNVSTSQDMLSMIKNLSEQYQDQEDKILDWEGNGPYGDDDKIEFRLFNQKWKEIISTWTVDAPAFQFIRDLILAEQINNLMLLSDQYITAYAENTHYIGPTRTKADRYRRIQDLAADEVDSDGENLAMFLWSLGEEKRQNFAAWTEKVLGFTVSVQVGVGHISLMLKESDSKIKFNVADMGFGFSQILPIVTQLWVLLNSEYSSESNPITFAIEQPELHLHPTLQAKLADAFLAAIQEAKERKIDLRLIIETHSEVIINRLGHRVARKEIMPNEINVVLFDKKSADAPTQVRIAQYDEDGFLTNWPFGFFEPNRI